MVREFLGSIPGAAPSRMGCCKKCCSVAASHARLPALSYLSGSRIRHLTKPYASRVMSTVGNHYNTQQPGAAGLSPANLIFLVFQYMVSRLWTCQNMCPFFQLRLIGAWGWKVAGKHAHAGSRARGTSMGGLYVAATLQVLLSMFCDP